MLLMAPPSLGGVRLGERWTRLPWGVRLLLVAGAYYASAQLGLRLALVGDIVTPLWPPTGVAVVALAVFGFSFWPAIALAAFAVNVSLADSAVVAAEIAVGNTLAPLVGALLLRRLDFDPALNRRRDAIVLVVVALASMTISATIGTAAVAGDTSASTARHVVGVVDGRRHGRAARRAVPLVHRRRTERKAQRAAAARSGGALRGAGGGVVPLGADRASCSSCCRSSAPSPGGSSRQERHRPALLASVIVIEAATNEQGIFAGETLLARMALLQAFNASAGPDLVRLRRRRHRTARPPARPVPARAPHRRDVATEPPARSCPNCPASPSRRATSRRATSRRWPATGTT